MDVILAVVLGILALFSVVGSVMLLRVGVMIDRHPAPDDEQRERSLASPIETTRIAVGLYWGLFLLGGIALLQGSRNLMIIGITTLFGIGVFLITTLLFSFTVLGLMRQGKKGGKTAKPGSAPPKRPKFTSRFDRMLRRH